MQSPNCETIHNKPSSSVVERSMVRMRSPVQSREMALDKTPQGFYSAISGIEKLTMRASIHNEASSELGQVLVMSGANY